MADQVNTAENANDNKQWNYYPLKDRFREYSATAASAVFYGLALSQIFNPTALGIAAAYGVGKTAYSFWSMTREGAAQKLVDEGYLSEPQQTRTQAWTDEGVEFMGMKPHKAYRVEDKMIKAVTPWYMRWAIDLVPDLKQSMMEKAAFALSTHDLTAYAGEFLDKYPERQERFAVMHELGGHCKNEDSYKPANIFKVLRRSTIKPLLYATGIAIVAGAVGLGPGSAAILSLGLIKGAAALAAAGFVANLGLNYSSRIMERRADRNAVYLTGDPQAGIELMENLHEQTQPKPHEAILRPFVTHPVFGDRIANIREAANLAASYPRPQTAVAPEVAATSSNEEAQNDNSTIRIRRFGLGS